MKQIKAVPSPVLGTIKTEPAPTAGFRFLKSYGDMKGTIENIDYRKAKIHATGAKWFVSYQFRNPDTGKMERFKVYEDINRITDPKQRMTFAEKLRDAVNLALSEGWNPYAEINSKKEWTFIHALNYYKQYLEGDNNLRLKTRQSYMTVVKLLADFRLKHEHIAAVTQTDLVKFMEQLKRDNQWGNKTYNGYLGYTGAWLAWLVKEKIIEKNVLEDVERRKTTPVKHKAFSTDEFDRLFKRLKQKADSNLYWFCRFVYFTGTRPKSETRLLQLKHVLFDRKLLFIPGHISKNKKDDHIPLADELLTWLEGFRDLPKDYFIFSLDGPGPEPLGLNTMATRFKEVREEMKFDPNQTIYALKHTRAIHLAQAGISPYLIMQLFRHSSLDMTMRYLRDLGLNVSREAVDV